MNGATNVEFTERGVREQLDRVTQSEALKRSRRLQQFLRYVTELTLAGDGSKINEYLLAIEVFERGPNYNASEDSVVRRQAHALRHKLSEYYSSEGLRDPIQIEIPLGHYVPVFRRNEGASPTVVPPLAVPAENRTSSQSSSSPYLLGIVMASALLVGLAFWVGRMSSPSNVSRPPSGMPTGSSEALRELWAPWFNSDEGPVICFSSPMSAVVKHFPEPLPANSVPSRTAVPLEMDRVFREVLGLDDDGFLYLTPSRSESKSGEALGSVALASLFGYNGLPTRATNSGRLAWDDFRRENMILFGHNEQNQWIDPILADYPLQLEATSGDQQRRIVNTRPMEGERDYYEIAYPASDEDSRSEYALISMIPGTDGLRELLLVSGLNTQATLMAVEFLTDANRAEQILGALQAMAPDHVGSWHFQLVLRAEVRDQAPTGGTIELIRIVE
jgi:hypothetical protein